jgi:hypothetical protein
MSTAQEIGLKVQEQALETVRMTQDAVIEAVTAWSETASKLAAQLPDFVTDYKAPDFADFTKQFPTAADVIDSNFDFAQRILATQREFAQRIAAAAPANFTKPLGA